MAEKSATQRSLMFDGVKLFNEIPCEVRSVEGLENFKNYCSVSIKNKGEL